jgi:hypothetical protein
MQYNDALDALFQDETEVSSAPAEVQEKCAIAAPKKRGRPRKVQPLAETTDTVSWTFLKEHECPHTVQVKYVTKHGLVCENCLTAEDFRQYPAFQKLLEDQKRRAVQARKNFHHGE